MDAPLPPLPVLFRRVQANYTAIEAGNSEGLALRIQEGLQLNEDAVRAVVSLDVFSRNEVP